MSDAAFVRILAAAMLREVVGTTPNLAEQERAVMAGMSALSERYAGERVSVYVPKVGTQARARLAREIRAEAQLRGTAELARKFGVSQRHVQRLIRGRTASG